MEAWDGLDERDRTRLIILLFRYFKCLESLHYQYSTGIMDEELWIGWRTQLAEYANTPAGKAFLAVRRTWFSAQFIALIESFPTSVTHVSAANLASRSSD